MTFITVWQRKYTLELKRKLWGTGMGMVQDELFGDIDIVHISHQNLACSRDSSVRWLAIFVLLS